MTYDGFGRLEKQTRSRTERETITAWTYNADDTINTITDARGGGYNLR